MGVVGCACSRRAFLGGLSALACGHALAQGAPGRPSPYRVDVHHHLTPPGYVARAARHATIAPPQAGWTIEKTVEDMDRAGTETAILSVTSPGFWFGDATEARDLARASNDYAAGLVRDHGRRFGSFAALPMPDVEGTLREIEYALDTLRADGVAMFTSYGGKWLGDPSFAPVFEELNGRRAVVYTHPNSAACCTNLMGALVPDPMIEFGTDTTRTIASWVFGGFAQRFPDVRLIFSHAGGTMPFLIERFEFQARVPSVAPHFLDGVRPILRRYHYDTAQASNPAAMDGLRRLVPVSQIVFGTDYPYRTSTEHVENLAGCGFDAAEMRAIERDNARALLPRLSA
ncbi:amidohydrolase family protein [Roseomonas sp. CCTCC AB2023176]|uniref:amidohydrolase family protein n=1 Tax=Roseomonas sp. CCTCC AB2023176 TaxID=3342640 RepID=UPI0035DE12A1